MSNDTFDSLLVSSSSTSEDEDDSECGVNYSRNHLKITRRSKSNKQVNDDISRTSEEEIRPVDQDDEQETVDINTENSSLPLRGLSRRLSKQLSRRLSTASLQEVAPKTVSGWTILSGSVAAAILGYEINLQKSLTNPPIVYGQCNDDAPIAQVHNLMMTKNGENSVLKRPVIPSLFVGTRSALSSAAAYSFAGPEKQDQHVKFRESMRMPQDGAVVAIDWELPVPKDGENHKTLQERKDEIFNGPIQSPVVLILHGINNDTSFGYIQSMMRACCERQCVAAAMNFRGCGGGVPLTTPRTYNGAYTGDIRSVVQILSARFGKVSGKNNNNNKRRLFLVGHSLGANLVAKYLGEEGKSNTLPECVAGGVTLGNPMAIDSRNMSRIYSPLIAVGTKMGLLSVRDSMKHMMRANSHFHNCIYKALTAFNLASYDCALAPIFCRNEPDAPFQYRIGYYGSDGVTAAQDYWKDASSYRQTRFVSVPMLQLVASDDFLVYGPHMGKLAYNISNPNIMTMTTRCGGHLGWHEAPPQGWGVGKSWADAAVGDFIEAVLDYHELHYKQVAPAISSRL